MVKLEEVLDEEYNRQQTGPQDDEEGWDTDDDSDVSSVTSEDAEDETLADRIAALKDVIPPTYRAHLSTAATTSYSWLSSGLKLSGQTLWVVSTSALLLGVPWALAFSEEQQVQEMEREMRMQQNANELLTQGSTGGQTGARPAL